MEAAQVMTNGHSKRRRRFVATARTRRAAAAWATKHSPQAAAKKWKRNISTIYAWMAATKTINGQAFGATNRALQRVNNEDVKLASLCKTLVAFLNERFGELHDAVVEKNGGLSVRVLKTVKVL